MLMKVFLPSPMSAQGKGLCNGSFNTTYLFGRYHKLATMFKQDIETSKRGKRKKNQTKTKEPNRIIKRVKQDKFELQAW